MRHPAAGLERVHQSVLLFRLLRSHMWKQYFADLTSCMQAPCPASYTRMLLLQMKSLQTSGCPLCSRICSPCRALIGRRFWVSTQPCDSTVLLPVIGTTITAHPRWPLPRGHSFQQASNRTERNGTSTMPSQCVLSSRRAPTPCLTWLCICDAPAVLRASTSPFLVAKHHRTIYSNHERQTSRCGGHVGGEGSQGLPGGCSSPWCLNSPASQPFTEGVTFCLYPKISCCDHRSLCSHRAAVP